MTDEEFETIQELWGPYQNDIHRMSEGIIEVIGTMELADNRSNYANAVVIASIVRALKAYMEFFPHASRILIADKIRDQLVGAAND